MTGPYDDMLYMERPHSRRAKMSAINRAAQFAPFAALNGHEAAILESGRLTDHKRELDETEKACLNRKLCALAASLDAHPEVTVTYFLPDERKQGGSYESFCGRLVKIQLLLGILQFEDGTRIPIEDISEIREGDYG